MENLRSFSEANEATAEIYSFMVNGWPFELQPIMDPGWVPLARIDASRLAFDTQDVSTYMSFIKKIAGAIPTDKDLIRQLIKMDSALKNSLNTKIKELKANGLDDSLLVRHVSKVLSVLFRDAFTNGRISDELQWLWHALKSGVVPLCKQGEDKLCWAAQASVADDDVECEQYWDFRPQGTIDRQLLSKVEGCSASEAFLSLFAGWAIDDQAKVALDQLAGLCGGVACRDDRIVFTIDSVIMTVHPGLAESGDFAMMPEDFRALYGLAGNIELERADELQFLSQRAADMEEMWSTYYSPHPLKKSLYDRQPLMYAMIDGDLIIRGCDQDGQWDSTLARLSHEDGVISPCDDEDARAWYLKMLLELVKGA